MAVTGVLGVAFTIHEWWLYLIGTWPFMILMPAAEAAEQTLIRYLVPFETQGRVFGCTMTFETAADPTNAFKIEPSAEFWITPYMDSQTG